MNNTLIDLHNFLMGELERLDNEELTETQMHTEVARAKAMTGVAAAMTANAAVMLKAKELQYAYGADDDKTLEIIGGTEQKCLQG